MPETSPAAVARDRLLIGLALALHLLPLVAGAPLIDPDEGLHAAIAREMIDTGNWLVPHFLGSSFLDKPILYFWALASSVAVVGYSEFAVRLPGALFGVAGVVTTALFARTLVGPAAFAPTMFVASTLAAPFAMLLAPVHDVALVPFTTLTLLAFWQREHDDGGWPTVLSAGLALGLAVLTKGLAGVALVGLAWGAYLVLAQRLTVRAIGDGAVTLAVALLVAAPWYGLVEHASPGYLRYFFLERHLMGFTTTTQNHGLQPWWYYVPVLAIGSLPWLGWLAAGVATALTPAHGSAPQPRRVRSAIFLLCWLVSNALFLSAAGSKLLTYALPVFPAVALVVVHVWSQGVGVTCVRSAKFASWIEGLSIAALPLGAAMVALSDGPLSAARLWLLGLCAVGGGALWLLSTRTWRSNLHTARGDASPPLWPRAAVIAAVYAGVVACLYGPVASRHSAKALSAHFNESGRLPRRLFVFDERLGSLLFYLTPALRAECSTDRLRPVDFGELRQAARTMALGDVVAIPTQAVALVSRSLPVASLSFVPVVDRYRLYSAPELLQVPAANGP